MILMTYRFHTKKILWISQWAPRGHSYQLWNSDNKETYYVRSLFIKIQRVELLNSINVTWLVNKPVSGKMLVISVCGIVAPIIWSSWFCCLGGPKLQFVVLQAHIATALDFESGPNSIIVKFLQSLSFPIPSLFNWFITLSGISDVQPLTVPFKNLEIPKYYKSILITMSYIKNIIR